MALPDGQPRRLMRSPPHSTRGGSKLARMGIIDQLLARHQGYADTFDQPTLPSGPSLPVAIVACMDARIETGRVLGLVEGEAHIIRNAGGVVTDDVIRSLTISQRYLDTREIMVIQHTDCGLMRFSDAEFREQIAAAAGVEPPFAIEAFRDLDENVRRSLARIQASPFIAHKDCVRGFVFSVESGRLREVAPRE
jgi:carbonic anhydrase